MKLVVDASVAVKWLMRDRPDELDTDKASALLGAIARRSVSAIEPVHWVAEVVGVVTRIKPNRAAATIALLTHARFSTVASRPRIGVRRSYRSRSITTCSTRSTTLSRWRSWQRS